MFDISSKDEEQEQGCLVEESEISINSDWIKQYLDMLHEGISEVVLLGEVNKPNGGNEDDGCVVLDGRKPSYMCEQFTNWV